MIVRVLKSILKSINWTALSVIVAAVALFFNYSALRDQTLSNRPYFGIVKLQILENTKDKDLYGPVLEIENVGKRSASDLNFKMIIIDPDLTTSTLKETSIVNEAEPGGHRLWLGDGYLNKNDPLRPKYLVIQVDYKDIILNQNFSQFFFMKLPGIEKDEAMTKEFFADMETEDKLKVKEYLKKNGLLKEIGLEG